ncbi:MAG: ATP-binding cassette domain-containing protein [Candidatus Nezhaarchaeales archaeon]
MKRRVLEVRDLWFRYDHKDWVLKGINICLNEGERVLIIGETGSGKTTLARVLTGSAKLVYEGDVHGSIVIEGRELGKDYVEVPSNRIMLIGQNPYLYFTEPLVFDDLYGYALRMYKSVEKATKVLDKVVETTKVKDLMNKYFFELSGGQAKRVLVAKALISDPLIFIFDEPLMWLDDVGVDDFIKLLKILEGLEKSVIIFEHRFMPLIKCVNKIYTLKGGLLTDVTSKALSIVYGERRQLYGNLRPCTRVNGDVLLEATEVSFRYGRGDYVLKDINLKVRRDEMTLIYGLNGQGKTTLLKILSGYLKPSKGKVTRKADVLYVPQNINLFYTESTVENEVTEICKARKMEQTYINTCLDYIKSLNIDLKQSPFNLSHGQMVKLALELARISNAKILLLDEPFSGLTYKDRLKVLEHLAKNDVTTIVATSNLDIVESRYWNKVYGISAGKLIELNLAQRTSLLYASKLYEEIIGEKDD